MTVSDKSIIRLCAPLFVCVCAFAVSLFFFLSSQPKDRRVLYFFSYDSDRACTEVRYLPSAPVNGSVAMFVDELLLGPITNRYKRLFPRGTTAEYCFEKNGVLYVGLSKDALYGVDGVGIRESVSLFRLNIVKNFTYLNKIDVAIDGTSVYEDS